MQNHYNNEKGSLYQFAEDHGLNSWEFDLVKRIVRCRKKGQFREDLEKSKFLIDLYLLEMEEPTPYTNTIDAFTYEIRKDLTGLYCVEIFFKNEFDKVTDENRTSKALISGWENSLAEAEQIAKEWIAEQMEEPTPAPVTTYSYSVIPNPFGYYFRIREKGEIIYFSKDYGRGFRTHLDATRAAQEWIKEQEEVDPYLNTTNGFTYCIQKNPFEENEYTLEIYKEGDLHEVLRKKRKIETFEKAEQVALEWIKDRDDAEAEKRYKKWVEGKEEPKPEYTYALGYSGFGHDFTIYKDGEELQTFHEYETSEEAERAALKWIKANTNQEKGD